MRRRLRRALAAAGAAAAILAGPLVGSALAAFTSATGASGTFSAASDFAPPSVTAAVIQKTAGGLGGAIGQGRTYRVYANVVDAGNPPTGIATVRADVSAVTPGQTAVVMTAGSYTVAGVSYNYASGTLTAGNPLAEGTRTYSVTAIDVAANASTTLGFVVLVDNTRPVGVSAATTNAGTAGLVEQGDTLTLTFSEPLDPSTILSGWNGSATNVVVRVTAANRSLVTVRNASSSAQLPLGTWDLRNRYVSGTAANFGSAGVPSVMTMSGSQVTIVLGARTSGTPQVGQSTTQTRWTTVTTPTDPAGNSVLATTVLGPAPPTQAF
ncbi:MAG: hypothetical protein IPM45_06335 [Acidimicrobiales bacterium]|nr:hypothetical protein [Acidimicrobiales bacterium]